MNKNKIQQKQGKSRLSQLNPQLKLSQSELDNVSGGWYDTPDSSVPPSQWG